MALQGDRHQVECLMVQELHVAPQTMQAQKAWVSMHCGVLQSLLGHNVSGHPERFQEEHRHQFTTFVLLGGLFVNLLPKRKCVGH